MHRLFKPFLVILARAFYGLLWLIGAVLFLIPFRLKKTLASGLAFLWFDVFAFRRKVVLHNLSRVFPRKREEGMGEFKKRCEALGRANIQHVILCFFEIFERFHWSDEVVKRRVKVLGFENIETLIKDRQGFFVTTAHLGNWELMTLVGVVLKAKLMIVTKFLRNSFFDELWVQSRRKFGLELLQERGSGMGIVKAIKQGKVVGFIMDQHTGEPHGILSEFLGLPAMSPKGLAILSLKLEVPVIPAFMIRTETGNFEVTIESDLNARFRGESVPQGEEALSYHVRLCNENMERWIRKYPEQYLWLHRRFKNVIDYKSPLVWEL